MKNWEKDINDQIASYEKAYKLKALPYQRVPEKTFDEILESQVSPMELAEMLRYAN